jgi:hypothetical protein
LCARQYQTDEGKQPFDKLKDTAVVQNYRTLL